MTSAGTEAIADLVKRHGARAVARKLGVDHKSIAKLAKGSKPRAAMLAKLKAQYSVDPALFASGEKPTIVPATAKRRANYSKKYSAKTSPEPSSPERRTAIASEMQDTRPAPGSHLLEGPLDSRSALESMVRGLSKQLEALNADPKATARERSQVASAVTAAMRLVTKLDGSTSLTMSGILRSDHWVKLRDGLCEVLAPHPEALSDVSVFLRKLSE